MRFHDLRHSCATFLVATGVDPKSVQELLGHTTIRLTMDTYVHAMPENLRPAARAMDRVLDRI
jgi:integrase